jgi:hypothetical protein
LARIPYNPAVRLACKKCRTQTGHVLIDFSNDPGSVLTLSYECQECFTVKKVFELNTLPELKIADANEIEDKTLNGEIHEQPLIPIEKGPQISR